MSGSSSDNDTFWPGYVDAISNLVLNLLFVVAILTIAVFLFALELGRRQMAGTQKIKGAQTEMVQVGPKDAAKGIIDSEEKSALEAQVKALKKELEQVKAAAVQTATQSPATANKSKAADDKSSGEGLVSQPAKVLPATEKASEPEKEIQSIQPRMGGIVIVFSADAVALSTSEAAKAKEALAPIKSAGSAKVEVQVPLGFSETKRLAFYRAMAVRNLLIEMGLAPERINIALPEVKNGGDSGRVNVWAQ